MESESIDPEANLNKAKEQDEPQSSSQRNELPRILQKSDSVSEEVVIDISQVEDDKHDDD
jgi:hypothetical protein